MTDSRICCSRLLVAAVALAIAVLISSQPARGQSSIVVDAPGLQTVTKVIRQSGPTPFLPAPGEAEQRILASLNEKTKTEFIDTPLTDAVQFLAMSAGISIIIDGVALDDEGIPTDEPINLSLTGVSLRSTLKIMLENIGLTWVIEDEVLKITSKTVAARKQLTRVYPVGDLADPVEQESWKELIATLQSGVTDAEWEDVDGTGGSVTSVRAAGALVIRQTRATHEKIGELLHSLREARQLGAVAPLPRDAQALFDTLVPPVPVAAPVEIPLIIGVTLGENGQPRITMEDRTESLPDSLKRLQKLKRTSVLIRADADVQHESVVSILDSLQKAGIEKISVAVRESQPKSDDVSAPLPAGTEP